MRIREAQTTDAGAIAKVHVDSWRTTYPGLDSFSYDQREVAWRDILSSAEGFTYVAEDDKGMVFGFAGGGPERSGDPVYKGELYAIYLLEEHQRKGVGQQLTTAVAKRLLQDGFQSMLVWVLSENPARRFYEVLGGELLREQEITIGGASLVEVAYGWGDVSNLAKTRG